MLSLREKIHRNPIGACQPIADHQDFRRSRNHVNSNFSKQHCLCFSHKDIARPNDFINTRDSLSPKGKSGNSLSTTNGEYFIHSRYSCCSKNNILNKPIWSRNYHNDFRHTSHFSWYYIHENRRRIRRLSPRHVNPHSLNRNHTLS